MFELGGAWWEQPARAAILYGALLLFVRLSGRRTVGQFTPFDLLVVMLLSESVSQGLTGGEQSVTGALLGAATLVGLNLGVAYLTSHVQGAQHLLEGREILIGRDGKVFDDVLHRHRVPRSDFEQALREADCAEHDMKCAFLEADGKISILREVAAAEASKRA